MPIFALTFLKQFSLWFSQDFERYQFKETLSLHEIKFPFCCTLKSIQSLRFTSAILVKLFYIENFIIMEINKIGFASDGKKEWTERTLSYRSNFSHIFHLAFEMNFFYVILVSLAFRFQTLDETREQFQRLLCDTFPFLRKRSPTNQKPWIFILYPLRCARKMIHFPLRLLPFRSSSLPLNAWMKLN